MWSGAVLTGGASSRMGRDKALLEVGGDAMARRVADALTAAGASAVACVGGDADALRALGLDVVPDDHPGDGPLGAVLSALSWTAQTVCLLAPCDHVDPSPAAFRAIVHALLASEALAAVPVLDGVRYPLNAALRVEAKPALQSAFDAGERSVRRALAALGGVVEVRGIGAAALADADGPGELPGSR